MLKNINFKVITGLSAVLLLITACSSATQTRQSDDQQLAQSTQKSGVQLWADNCARCHNIRPPDSYSDAQWDVAVLHMRIRANLAAEDARAIVDYLKSAN
jgi:mono/diheme cytochrome c family protein